MKFMKSAYGLTIVQVLVGTVISGLMLSGITASIMHIVNVQKNVEVKLSLQQVRDKIYWTVLDEIAWKNTVADAVNQPNMDCLLNSPYVCSGSTLVAPGLEIIKVIGPDLSAADPVVIDNTPPGAGLERGFDWDGNKCVGAAAGDDNCPIRVVLKWYANSTDPRPNVVISAEFQVKITTALLGSLNASRFNFTLQKRGVVNVLTNNDTTCSGSGQYVIGLDSAGNLICAASQTVKLTQISCPPGKAVTSINSSGVPTCKQVVDFGNCPAGEFIDQISSDGSVQCTPLPQVGANAPDDKVSIGFDSFGSPIWGPNLDTKSCAAGYVMTGFDSTGGLRCTQAPTGATSCTTFNNNCLGPCVPIASLATSCTPNGCAQTQLSNACTEISCYYTTTCTSNKTGLTYSCQKLGHRQSCTRKCQLCT